MSCRRIVAAAMVVALSAPAAALAAGSWVWPVGSSSVSVPYGAAYTAPDGRRCTHGGVDFAAPAGSRVGACAGGQVAFAGSVPAGSGQRTLAVTVATDDGLRVTYLPLDDLAVHAGGRVEAGEDIGRVAAAGDGSSASPHLHLGVKRGSRQLDPMAFLGADGVPSQAPVPRPLTLKALPVGPGPGLPTRSQAAEGVCSPGVAPVASAEAAWTASRAGAAKPGSASDLQAARASFGSSLHAIHSASVMEALPSVPIPMSARVARMLATAIRARDGIAWVVVRLMLIAAGVLCLRPVLHAMRRVATVPEPALVRRVRA
jgi:hypothetical protein